MDLLITIGGSGQQLALTAARLVRLGALPPLRCVVLDSHDDSAISKKLKTFFETSGLAGHPLVPGKRSVGAHGNETLQIFPPYAKGSAAGDRFIQLFVDVKSPQTEIDLFDLFFDAEEGNTQVSRGMFGRPNVGATVFAHGLDTALSELFKLAKSEDRIYVAGSFIGGTGAGVTHEFIKKLRREVGRDKPIHGLFLLNWLSRPAVASSADTISEARMHANMRHGLTYFFDETIQHLDNALLVGAATQDGGRYGAQKIGDDASQDAVASALLLVLARGIKELPDLQASEGRGKVYAYGTQGDNAFLKMLWHHGEKDLERQRHEAEVVHDLLAFTCAKQKEIKDGFSLIGKAYIGGLHKCIKTCAPLLGKEPKALVDALLPCLEANARQLENSVKWLSSVQAVAALPLPLKQKILSPKAMLATLEDCWRDPWRPGPGETVDVPEMARRLESQLFGSIGPLK